jgi:hypothetical protein
MQNVQSKEVLHHANAFMDILEILMSHVALNARQMLNALQTKHVKTLNVLIHARGYAVSMPNAGC